ncbi:hypothetical protein PoB_004053500 [Plakobranchus ocellatus]|uniref:Uncharacterized protein n=1 Tax=Plakobranchus ocellatus TaxID=259542 RepID=A0AAV4B387_9GAST|nr:hypothetical protein PoB_004053500 [Plakobranchus ocellatus]
MWFIRRMIRLSWMENKPNEFVLKETNLERSLIKTIRQSTKWAEQGFLRPCESKGGEENNGKLPHMAVFQEHPGPYSWFVDVWTKRVIKTGGKRVAG